MLTIKLNNIIMEYGGRRLFNIKAAFVYSNEKIGIIGANGSGKTTLLDIIAGREKPVSGNAELFSGFSYIDQLGLPQGEACRQIDYSWAADGEPMSGGEIMRRKLAEGFGTDAGILLCDEPTSNLDELGIVRLERALKNIKGTLLLVSHDRQLLDSVCTKIWELDGALKEYSGNYSSYINEKEKQKQNERKEYEKYLEKKNRLEAATKERSTKAARMKHTPRRMGNSEARLHRMDVRQRAGKVSKASGQISSRLEKLEKKDKPKEQPKLKLFSSGEAGKQGRIAVAVENLSFSYGQKKVIDDLSFYAGTGEKIAVTGSNGSGKTTLLNCIANAVPGVRISPLAETGYFRQGCPELDEGSSILEFVMRKSRQPEHTARTILAGLGIKRDDVYKKISVLLGGERCKVSLCALVCQNPTIMLLDEPTNYLDIYVLSALEEMLESCENTLLLVSHDRFFRSKVTDRQIDLDGKG